ncbi:hypothetical protein EPUS_06934 [Endocarpon pusillum Z07020]|uniref:Uncharacterized protein n=1 Tax=Endocarpon pusillum (strain Z07020 / HMAS-L-300199) TaxID=1263415 RepID=U1G830_ENDPU|nr:uncharacterized protein EPUS_06934 [Endocarpon pusillum Z07020]ERF68123.1 hypothetical protein EPUS_06934 [Endocarpon pusillum Z07020]
MPFTLCHPSLFLNPAAQEDKQTDNKKLIRTTPHEPLSTNLRYLALSFREESKKLVAKPQITEEKQEQETVESAKALKPKHRDSHPLHSSRSPPPHKEKRPLHVPRPVMNQVVSLPKLESPSNGPARTSFDGRPSSHGDDSRPLPIPVISLTTPNEGNESLCEAALRPLSSIRVGHPLPPPGRATVTVLVTNTDENGRSTSTTSTSETTPRSLSTDWVARPFTPPPRKLIANTQHGGQPMPGYHAPMPVVDQQFRQNNPPTTTAHPFMPARDNRSPFLGNQAPTPFVNMTPRHPSFPNNHGQNSFQPVQPACAQPYRPQASRNTQPFAEHPPPARMVPRPASHFPPSNQAPPSRVHTSEAPPDFRMLNSIPIRFNPYLKDASARVHST